MDALLALVPWWARLAVLGALAGVCIAFGFVQGLDHEQGIVARQTAALTAAATAQAVRTAQINAQSNQNAKDIDHAQADDILALRAHYDGMRLNCATTPARAVSIGAANPQKPDATGTQRVDAETKPASGGDTALALPPDFVTRCALDAQTVENYRQYVIKNKIPIAETVP